MHCSIGLDVGYQVRFDSATSDKTAIKYVTDGTLLRECLDSPDALMKYSAVILDEAHVRSLDTVIPSSISVFLMMKDILFGLVHKFIVDPLTKDTHSGKCPKLIIMSATLHAEKFSEFFQCPTYVIPGKLFPVDIVHFDHITPENYVGFSFASKAVDLVMSIHENKAQGSLPRFSVPIFTNASLGRELR